jgi:Short-chain dehydrogenases of various substrate specificities
MSAVVLITRASTGFGRQAAEGLARRGHRVFATMLAPYNAAAEDLRPIVARIFNVPELAGVQPVAAARG